MEINVNKEGVFETNGCNLYIKSITDQGSTEFVCGVEKETGKCKHFSIRAYVADICRKDWKICWPFSSCGDSKQPKEQADMLPPLHIPQFRWWCCENCLRNSASEKRICEGREAQFNDSVDMSGYECYPMMNLHGKEKFVDVISGDIRDVFASGKYENSLVRNVDGGILEPTCERKDARCLNEEIVINDAEAINLNFKGDRQDEPGKSSCKIYELDADFGNKNSKCASNCSTGICQKGRLVHIVSNEAKMSKQRTEVIACPQKPKLLTVENGVLGSCRSYTGKLCSLKFMENDESKDSDNIHDQLHPNQHDNSSSILNRRKPKKVRLLTDILRSQISGASIEIPSSRVVANSDNSNAKVIHTDEADDSDGLTLDTLFRSQVAVQKNVGMNKKKRKTLRVEEWEPFQMRRSKSGSENVRIHKTDTEDCCIDSMIASSASVNDEFLGVNLAVGFKSNSNKSTVDELGLRSKKNDTKARPEGRQSSSKPCQEILCRESHLMSKDVERKETGVRPLQFNLANDASAGRGFYPFRKCSVAAQECDQKFSFCSKESSEKGSLMLCSEGVRKEGQVVSKDVEISPAEATNMSLAYAPKAFSGRSAHCLKSKKDSFRRQKDFPFPLKLGTNIDAQGFSEIIENKSSVRATKACELETLHDIPMEIVELLAENRRERRLLEAENANRNKICISETKESESVKNARAGEFIEAPIDAMSRYSQEKKFQVQRKLKSTGGGIFTRGRSVEMDPSEVKLINYPSHYKKTCTSTLSNLNSLAESHDTKGYLAFSNSQENCSNRKQFAEAGSAGNFGIQSCSRNGDILGPSCPLTCLQYLKKEPKCSIVSCPTRCSEARHVCFQEVANGPLRIDSCQKFATFSQNQSRNYDVKIPEKKNVEQPCACIQKKIGKYPKMVSPSHLYTDATMHAMQLSRFMDGMSSRVSLNISEDMLFTQSSSPQCNQCNNLSPLTDVIYKISNADFSKNNTVGKSLEHHHSGPKSKVVSFSFQRDTNRTRTIGITGQVSEGMVSHTIRSGKKPKTKSSCATKQATDCRLDGSVSGYASFGKNHESFPINGLKKRFFSASNSLVFPLESPLIKDVIIDVGLNKEVGTVLPLKGGCMAEICYVNRNPADFSIPNAGNEFMISSGDFKRSSRISKRGRPSLTDAYSHKKHRTMKQPIQTCVS